ncbi:MAG: hypothetical protein K8H88_25935, partial [Sandaracinaceae bacterium]|nr:hypothetical protein [Sandaracinaceae bacterium]
AGALRAQSQGRHADACLGLQRVVEGATHDSPDQLARAQLGLGRCLYDLGLHHAAAGVFVEIAQRGAGHPSFDATLPWLARLATRVPAPSELIYAIGRYDAERVRSLAVPAGERDHLLYLLGRARYQQGELPDAISLLSQVAPGSPWSLPAKLTEGASHVRARRAGPAARAFRDVIEAIRAGRTGGAEDPARLRDLAWISLARLYYSAALQDRDERRAADLLSRAYDAWGHITEGSEHFHDAFFEETWALYMARQPERALGHVHGITSPYFESSRYPEAIVVRAMIHYEHCQWNAVEAALREFHDRYDPLLGELERTAERFPDHEAAFGLLISLHERRAHVPPSVQPSLRSALGDRELLRHAAQVRSIDRERARLEGLRDGSGAPIAGSELHDRVAADLSIARAMAIDRAGEQAQARLTRLIDELRERQTQMDTVELELATARREELAHPNASPMGDANGGRIVAVQGDQTWPFDGEYWPDEVPYYRQVVVDRCIR